MNTEADSDYRPWHRPLAHQLYAALQQQKLHHALLLLGPVGLGKRHFASHIAALLLCEQRLQQESVQACGKCRSCELHVAGTHPDYFPLGIEEDAKQISVSAVRELREKLLQTAQMQGAKVCLIDPADLLNDSSANALLKLLEEPPAETYFILVVDQPQLLLPTIRSRCLPLRFALPARETLGEFLQSLSATGAQVEQLLKSSRGFPELALEELQRLQQDSSDGTAGGAEPLLEHWLQAEAMAGKRLGELAKQPLAATLDSLQREVHDIYLQSLVSGEDSRSLGLPQLHALQQSLLAAKRDLPRNPNPLLLLESLQARCRHIAGL